MNPIPKIAEIVSYFKTNWTELLTIEQLESLCSRLGYHWRARVLGPGQTIQLFLLQILLGNTSCNHLRYYSELEFGSTAYCDARQRIPLGIFEKLVQEVGKSIATSNDYNSLWHGHRIFLADGSGCSMPDTEELREHFGQPGNQRKACGFPVAHLLVLMNHSTGMIQKMINSPLRTHDLPGTTRLCSELKKGDVVVLDQGFCSCALILSLSEEDVHSVIRVSPSHNVDFRKSGNDLTKGIRRKRVARLGNYDQLIEWHKPNRRPKWLSKEEFDSLPDFIVLREVCYNLDRKGFRSDRIILVTTLNDHEKYSRAAIAELYGMRWEVETNFRHLKLTMKMDALKCKTVDGVKKELCMFALVYNLVRQAMIARAITYKQPLDRISFIDTLRWLLELQSNKHNCPPIINPFRPGRSVARVVKRRPKAYPRMTSKRKISIGITPKDQLLMA